MNIVRFIILAVFGISAFAVPAFAADGNCTLKRAAHAKITFDPGGRPTIPVTVDGKAEHLLVDTGGIYNSLDADIVKQLGLSTINASLDMVGVNGAGSSVYALVHDFGIGPLHGKDWRFVVFGRDTHGTDDSRPDTPTNDAFVGTLAPKALAAYDADFDFAKKSFNLFSQDHCPGAVFYWKPKAAAAIPFTLDRSLHVVLPVTIDGKTVKAIIDTGSTVTTMNLRVAKQIFGIDPEADDLEKAGTLKGVAYNAPIYKRRFKTIDLNGLVVTNPVIQLLPDMITPRSSAPPTGSLIKEPDTQPALPDVILGMSVLSKVHLYIAYKERKVYVTPP